MSWNSYRVSDMTRRHIEQAGISFRSFNFQSCLVNFLLRFWFWWSLLRALIFFFDWLKYFSFFKFSLLDDLAKLNNLIPFIFDLIIIEKHEHVILCVLWINPRNQEMIIALLKMYNFIKHNIQIGCFLLLILIRNSYGVVVSQNCDKLKINLINIFES